MTKLTNDKKLRIALTLMQVMCVIALLLGTYAAIVLGMIGVTGLSLGLVGYEPSNLILILASLMGLLTVLITSVCSYIAIIRYIGMTRRLKKERAFTEQNGHTLSVIAKMCIICAVTLLIGYALTFLCASLPNIRMTGWLTMLGSMTMVSVPVDVLAFMYLGVGLVSRALCGLLHRAKALQDENDLTV